MLYPDNIFSTIRLSALTFGFSTFQLYDLEQTIKQLDLTAVYGILYPTKEHTFFLSTHGTLIKKDHMLIHKPNINKFKSIKLYRVCSLFTVKLSRNCQQKDVYKYFQILGNEATHFQITHGSKISQKIYNRTITKTQHINICGIELKKYLERNL